jgi:serine/threonine protein kinase
MLGESASGAVTAVVRPSSELQEDQIKLGAVLGHGTFGTVYRGECFGLAVAVKVPFVGDNNIIKSNLDGGDADASNTDAADTAGDAASKKSSKDDAVAQAPPPVLSKEDLEDLKQEIRIMTYVALGNSPKTVGVV